MNRREALKVPALAAIAAATVQWAHARQPASAPERVRCGTPVTLEHPDAQAFRLASPGRPTVVVPAQRGRMTFRAPIAALPGFVDVTCTPLADGAAIGPAVAVAVYTPRLSWGA